MPPKSSNNWSGHSRSNQTGSADRQISLKMGKTPAPFSFTMLTQEALEGKLNQSSNGIITHTYDTRHTHTPLHSVVFPQYPFSLT